MESRTRVATPCFEKGGKLCLDISVSSINNQYEVPVNCFNDRNKFWGMISSGKNEKRKNKQ